MRRADYSKLADTYDEYRRPIDEDRDVWYRSLVRLGRLEEPADVLEVGSGTGRWAILLAETHRVVGMDPSSEMLEKARRKEGSDRVAWVRAGAPFLPFGDESFDRAVFVLVLQHIEAIEETFRETFRVLRPGGRIVIRTCAHDYIRRYPLGDLFPGYRNIELAAFPETGRLRKTLTRIGFRDVSSEDVSQTVTHPSGEYIDKVRNRFISTLDRIGEENFETGFERLRKELKGKESITYTIEHEHITGVKE
jgi:ubiquinone/menaquinone biosynthesis C-methylase UbiE